MNFHAIGKNHKHIQLTGTRHLNKVILMGEHICHTHLEHQQSKALTISLWIAFAFMILEVIGGIIANSLALMTDALHMFTDVGAMVLGLIVLRITRMPKNPKMSYGYHRAEVLGALASALSLWALSAVLVYMAIKRLIYPPEVNGPIVFILALFGLAANFLMMWSLHSSRESNLNLKAAYLHVIGDLAGSVAVILGGLLLWITKWNPIDPIISLVFTAFILYGTSKLIKQAAVILMEAVPGHLDLEQIEKELAAIPGVSEVHDLHIWSVSSNKAALSVHLVAKETRDTLAEAHRVVERHKIRHMTIQIEAPKDFERKYCYDCK